MTTPKFFTAKGRLTPYSFGCGYQERRELSNGVEVTLYKDGGPAWHVRAYDKVNKVRVFWECFNLLTNARQYFDKQGGKLIVSREAAEIARKYRATRKAMP